MPLAPGRVEYERMGDTAGVLTRLLGDDTLDAAEKAQRLVPLVYQELRSLAQARLNEERAGHTLAATALVHETYLRMFGGGDVPWRNRAHFFDAAGTAMRRILIDYARKRGAIKRGGGNVRVDWDGGAALGAADGQAVKYLALEEALQALEHHDERSARVVMLRFYAGLTSAEAADALGVSERTVKYEWEFARAWLARRLHGDDDREQP